MTDKQTVILFGAGQLGRRTAECIRDRFDVVFADNDSNKYGTHVDGFCVLSPYDAVKTYGDHVPWVVTIYNGQPVHEQLKAAGVKDVRRFMDFYLVNADLCLPYACLELGDTTTILSKTSAVCDIVADRKSVDVLMDTSSALSFNIGSVKHDHPDNIYFPSFITPLSDEVFVDVGAFDGDTIKSLLTHRRGEFGKIVAFEPDSSNAWKLAEYLHTIGDFSNVHFFPCVVGNREGTVPFMQCASASSRVVDTGQTALCTTLDKILPAIPAVPTYIKCDAEGAELDVLDGAREMIAKYRPVLAWCCYHKQDHLWRIPLLMKEINPDYEIFIRCYAESPFEVVAYAVPRDRVEWDQVQR